MGFNKKKCEGLQAMLFFRFKMLSVTVGYSQKNVSKKVHQCFVPEENHKYEIKGNKLGEIYQNINEKMFMKNKFKKSIAFIENVCQ